MEVSSPAAGMATSTSTATRRKSDRVSKAPEVFGASSKRKRNDINGDDVDGEDASDASSDDDEEPDPEELKEKRRRARAAPKTKAPAKKKAKSVSINGDAVSLPIRPTKSAPKSAPKRRKPQQATAADAENAGGLYAQVFAQDQSLDDAAAWWLGQFNENENEAMADLFNFVLKCSGCDAKVEAIEVEDSDHFADKIQDLQEAFEAEGVYEYPLISRAKGMHTFRDNFTGTLSSLIATMAKTDQLYTNEPFRDVLNSWLATMSSTASRPFRHTAVVASLSIMTALCKISAELAEASGKSSRQAQGEKRRSKGTSKRVSEIDQRTQQAIDKREQLGNMLQDWFDSVFVHRYRDVDPRIRDECVRSLGQWIMILPDRFFEGQYLRYLGWILSDANKETRHEVIKALKPLYHDQSKLNGLRTFTERFRERLVEMAVSDSDKDVRAEVIKLLDVLREAGFLEPSDIDKVGRCIFESEPKIRKAVTPFLAETINELYSAKMEELGGVDSIKENIPQFGEDDSFEAPRPEWVKLKSLAEVIQGYDEWDNTEDGHAQRYAQSSNFINNAEQPEPRIALVAEALFDGVDELQDWEALSGYLLYDHSQTPDATQNGVDESLDVQLKQAYKLNEQEEVLLLEIMNTSVKECLKLALEKARNPRLTKAQKLEAQNDLEENAQHLAQIIPRLFGKFGSAPEATSSILRLYHVLNHDAFKDIARDVTDYEQLLEDVRKQFITHADATVLQEASQALLHAKNNEELMEITQGKLQQLWEDSVTALNTIATARDLSTRGDLADDVLDALSNSMIKISNLSTISDSTEHLEKVPAAPKTKKKVQTAPVSAIRSILAILDRGIPTDDIDADVSAQEDTLVLQSAQVARFYLMWKAKAAKSFVQTNGYVPQQFLVDLATIRDEMEAKLEAVIRSRSNADDVRVALAETYLDVYLIFHALGRFQAPSSVLRSARERAAEDDTIDLGLHAEMALEMPRRMQKTLLKTFTALEVTFAKRARKTLEENVDDDPVDVDEAPIDEDEDETREKERKMLLQLLAERKLCEFAGHLGLGIWAGVLDGPQQGIFDEEEEEDEDEQELLEAAEINGDAEEVARLRAKANAKARSKERKVGLVEERLKRNIKNLGASYKQVVDRIVNEHPDAPKKSKKVTGVRKAVPQKAAPAQKSKEIVVENEEESEREQEEVDLIEDPDAAPAEDEDADGMDVDAGAGADGESVLGE